MAVEEERRLWQAPSGHVVACILCCCNRDFGMLQVFHVDVTKIDLDVTTLHIFLHVEVFYLNVASSMRVWMSLATWNICCGGFFWLSWMVNNFSLIFFYVANVGYSCCICLFSMSQILFFNVATVQRSVRRKFSYRPDASGYFTGKAKANEIKEKKEYNFYFSRSQTIPNLTRY